MGHFGVSQAVTRREDRRLLTGRGRFTADAVPAGAAHAQLLRSPYAHAIIRRLDTVRAQTLPGVLLVITAADLDAAGVRAIEPTSTPSPRRGTRVTVKPLPALAERTLRFVGQPFALVVAETAEQARDAAEAIEVDLQPRPAVTATAAAAAADAPAVWEDVGGNISFDWELGERDAVQQAFAAAERVVSLDLVNNRVLLSALETRAALAEPLQHGRLRLTTGSQMPHGLRGQLAQTFGRPETDFQICVGDVGGGFGGKNSLYPEQVLTLYAAARLDRPVAWVGERSEGLLSDFAGRDNVSRGELALDADGRFLALRVTTLANLGGFTAGAGNVSPINIAMASNSYRIPAIYLNVKALFSHTAPTDPYRGAGRPEILYLVERLVDAAAFDLGVDRVELRRLNLIPLDAFPYRTPTGLVYDHCDFAALLDAALTRGRWRDFGARRAASARRGRLRGIGMANYVERCGGGGGLAETARLRFDAGAGVFELLIGTMSNGQGHDTAYSQILAERLGIDFDRIRIVQGDTDRIEHGLGTGGSWSIPLGGGAVCLAADALIERARARAAGHFETAAADIEFDAGRAELRVAGTDRRVALFDLARAAAADGEPLDGDARFEPDNYTFPYGCHVCEVEVDPATGAVRILSYAAIHDFGVALNPLLLAGQVHGGVTQGIGQALLERVVYDADGQLLSGSWSDYALPRADDLPSFVFDHRATPSPANPLGVKGCGEAGAAGAPPALVNAVADALGVRHIDMPLTAERVWRARLSG